MPATYEPIAKTTLASNTTTTTFLEFDNIPGTYTDLVMVIQGTAQTALDIWMRFNTDTGSNYSDTRLYGDGSNSGSDRNSSYTSGAIAVLSATQGLIVTNVMNYSNTTTNKTCISRSDTAGWGPAVRVTLWRSTSAVTKIQVGNPYASYLAAGTTATLYGVKAA